ncbi:UPF0481 protein At3g47200-like [Cornus florida]|uniref:UPF0481 protein At3g47200-like n=1 Tax=Cornus florida TaxID=4283 RepID=UPI002898CF30|nr:UPF0481 protein At3g47200-like [Cornus florida]
MEIEEETFSQETFATVMQSLVVKIEDNRQNLEVLFTDDAWPPLPVIKSVPNMLREENGQAYTPSVVSIGPLHNRNESLKTMETDKLRYMCFLFERTKNLEQTRKDCVEAMSRKEKTFKKCYPDCKQEVDDVTSSSRLVEMMLIDGCFIIELIYRHYKIVKKDTLEDKKDPILQDAFRHSTVLRDLLLLGNQIPFFAPEELFHLTVKSIMPGANLFEFVL